MEAISADSQKGETWSGGGNRPYGASYGKMMMWFFIMSDALTFLGFLGAYGFIRFNFIDSWPIADQVFTHIPFVHGVYPMYYVAFMTFVLIFSSVTMVLAVDAGKQMKQGKVIFYLGLTVVGGLIFLLSQAWEWKTFINGSYGAVELSDGKIVQFVDDTGNQITLESFAAPSHEERVRQTKSNGIWFEQEASLPPVSLEQVKEGFASHPEISLRTELINLETKEKTIVSREDANILLSKSTKVIKGADLKENEYGNTLFADLFFFITGFHGFHVTSGILINIIILINVILGVYQRRGHYEMVEKVGLYWHFVDLVWVFVFTFFYLI